ncbi:class I SAM-dependent DNA methyltransferase [Litoreibacter janthinus]|uniref:Methyltransferase domain-containing protein n=1 Tax=Litoreibacter janthinus TaxID=670154 RepID=A0A1I6H284_9RHOB|nr:methyltransferase domain-containing protein [Litoreibacter janthinus]SFR48523.1 Methyltransferase domain-containing protein [Litoreibacter janthinus]
MAEKFLDKVYETSGAEATRELYDAWSSSYNEEISENGYQTPRRVAQALATISEDQTLPVLDYGCGTGLSGAELQSAGFSTLDGADPSTGMLAQARQTGHFRELIELDLSQPLPFKPNTYQAITAIGVISTGAGPASLMDDLIALLPSGGLFGFSLNDHALADPEYANGVQRLRQAGHALRIENYGAHLPGLGLKSTIYIFEKK